MPVAARRDARSRANTADWMNTWGNNSFIQQNDGIDSVVEVESEHLHQPLIKGHRSICSH